MTRNPNGKHDISIHRTKQDALTEERRDLDNKPGSTEEEGWRTVQQPFGTAPQSERRCWPSRSLQRGRLPLESEAKNAQMQGFLVGKAPKSRRAQDSSSSSVQPVNSERRSTTFPKRTHVSFPKINTHQESLGLELWRISGI
jgi:hypothetical protein